MKDIIQHSNPPFRINLKKLRTLVSRDLQSVYDSSGDDETVVELEEWLHVIERALCSNLKVKSNLA